MRVRVRIGTWARARARARARDRARARAWARARVERPGVERLAHRTEAVLILFGGVEVDALARVRVRVRASVGFRLGWD